MIRRRSLVCAGGSSARMLVNISRSDGRSRQCGVPGGGQHPLRRLAQPVVPQQRRAFPVAGDYQRPVGSHHRGAPPRALAAFGVESERLRYLGTGEVMPRLAIVPPLGAGTPGSRYSPPGHRLRSASPRHSAENKSLWAERTVVPAHAKLAARDQNVLMAISAGAASNSAISWSRRLNVMDVPAISRDVQ